MSSFHEIDNYIEFIISWLEENEIGNSQKKRDKIARDIFIHVCQPNKITIENLKNIKNHISSHEFTKDKFSGNIWVTITEYFDNDPCYKLFFKDLSELRSYGYSTSPNAACGNFELLYRILRPNSRQPTRGDIKDGETEIDIKGTEIRVFHEKMTGKQYKTATDELFGPTNIEPNQVTRGGLKGKTAYEIEKPAYVEHYRKEFSRRTLEDNIQLMIEYLKMLDIEDDINESIKQKAQSIFGNDGLYNRQRLVDIIVQDFYKNCNGKWIIFGNGNNIRSIGEKKDLIKFAPYQNDFFRINQPMKIGWYISN